jgi:hypothetical protein
LRISEGDRSVPLERRRLAAVPCGILGAGVCFSADGGETPPLQARAAPEYCAFEHQHHRAGASQDVLKTIEDRGAWSGGVSPPCLAASSAPVCASALTVAGRRRSKHAPRLNNCATLGA